MEFFDYSLKLYKKIEESDFSKLSSKTERPLSAIIPYLLKNYSFDNFTKLYRDEIDIIVDNYLPMCKNDSKKVKELKSNYYYEGSVNTYSWMFLFWIWFNKIDIPPKKLKLLLRAEFMGMMGYRLLDIYSDNEEDNSDYLFLGDYLIRSFEEIFVDEFSSVSTFKVINHYLKKYDEIEYVEKNNLWKECPFNWNNAKILGYKTSPLISLFAVVFQHIELDEKRIKDIVDGFLDILAINQILDDVGDAASDLSVGRETLVMSGFYKKFGIDNSWTEKNIEQFLDQEQLKKIYINIQKLFDNATKQFTKHEDIIFLFFVEVIRYVFLKKFEIVTDE
jgi:hypothetical protein